MLNFIVSNFSALMAVLGAVLGVAVMIMHLAHKDAVANQIQAIEDAVNKLSGK